MAATIILSILAGWYIRKKSSEILAIRKANQYARSAKARKKAAEELKARQTATWKDIMKVCG